MRRPGPLPPTLGTAFTVGEARAAGASVDRLRASDLAHPFHGARARVTPCELRSRAAALAPLLLEDQHFSHATSAELQGLRMPEGRRSTALHLTYRHAHRAMRRPDVIGHKTKLPVRLTTADGGLPVSTPVDAWCECASGMRVDDLIVMGDGLVRRKAPVATLDELADAVIRWRGRRGSARLAAALDEIRAGTDSARETMLRLLLVRAGFPEPEVNTPLYDRQGRMIAHGDLVWPGRRTVMEYDGSHHALDSAQFAIDIRRLNGLADAGYRIIRVDKALMATPTRIFSLLGSALSS